MEHIRQAFNKFAQDYDSQREYIIPEMRRYYGAAVWAMETKGSEPAILDVGAGTGLLSAFLLEKFPRCPSYPDGHLREHARHGTETVCHAV
jgi:tRNA (cmo5U34)-methyltransferase